MSSILRVCLSSEIPAEDERLSNYFYFLYDRLILYKGSEKINSNYSISVSMPEDPVPNMFYILHDGTIHQYLDYSDTVVATIEEEEQIPLIRKAGTTYFINSDSRYIDKHDRTLVMPFNSETYELVVNYRDEDIFDDRTIVKYNEKTGQFELYSGEEKYEEYSRELKGKETSSVKTTINGSRLEASVKISRAFGNALKSISDGLFIRSDDKVEKVAFDQFYSDFKDLKAYCYAILDNLDAKINYLAGIVTREAITTEIHNQLVGEIPGIEQALSNFEEIRRQLDTIESTAMSYATNTMSTAISDIDGQLEEASRWKNIPPGSEEYTHEVNYYDKAKEYDNELGNSKIAALSTAINLYDNSQDSVAAISVGIMKYNDNRDDIATMALGIDMYQEPDCTNKEMAIVTTALKMYDDKLDDIAAISLGILLYESSIVPNNDIVAVSAGLELYKSEEISQYTVPISLAIMMYSEQTPETDAAVVGLGIELYNNEGN